MFKKTVMTIIEEACKAVRFPSKSVKSLVVFKSLNSFEKIIEIPQKVARALSLSQRRLRLKGKAHDIISLLLNELSYLIKKAEVAT